ncbi:MAG: cysteine--tRNA ligase [Alphaproteobacteria bacterium HGW-Alphaproteobacteria-2]|nr:MAG: cysteine--tRNA ligase [Alphaproteobacteria bacterium HGW-Alphaproteobacteria-2]
MGLRLYNTATRRKEEFRPLDPENVRMYVCGPTVYDRAHIGNARPVVVFDVLFRLLRHLYGPDHVTYVRNFTDVDDKINARAREMQAKGDGCSMVEIIRALTDETIEWYHADMDALGALRPTYEPRATDYIGQMVAMIGRLIDKRHAYAAEGHVLFDVGSYTEYGQLARRNLDEMRAGARVEVAPYKRDPMDFVLWKPSADDEPGWDSPWGRGRPGWHIECSAMSLELLGESFDIHGGGIDLAFPHHENEIAQSRCACPEGRFAQVWMHNGFLQVEGEKMSKSLGNFFTVQDLLAKGVPGEVIRLSLLMTHYRKPLDWTRDRVREATMRLANWQNALDGIEYLAAARRQAGVQLAVSQAAVEALSDDLNTKRFLDHCDGLTAENSYDSLVQLYLDLQLLGFDENKMRNAHFASAGVGRSQPGVSSPKIAFKISELLEERQMARQRKDWSRADEIRDRLAAAGVRLMDSPSTPTDWELGPDFDPAKLESLK